MILPFMATSQIRTDPRLSLGIFKLKFADENKFILSMSDYFVGLVA